MGQPAVKRATADSGHGSVLSELQRLRREVGDLELLLQVNSRILDNVCHEFRSALTAVRGYTKRLLEERSGPINEGQRGDLEVVQKNARKLLGLVSYSLPFVAEQRLRVESFDLREIWRQVASRMRFRLSERSITLREQIPTQQVVVTADKARLETAFEIILGNAINWSPNEGKISAELRHEADGEVAAEVLVTGVTVSLQVPESFCEHQVDPSLPDVNPGLPRPVGLSLAHDLVWLHGGRLAVRNTAGHGLVFTVTLPSTVTKPMEPMAR